ncbi:HAMP domain-containing protein [Rhizobium sp. CG5]|uniref:HAMP domain-containing methyl-accepting chemotaxis protein n=1 Tax=Rhizobium sp. CG5 TaxID=2726076 RepID=UPI0020337445|nr:methyl-accepting chemotaxis protein [Rhizobium sp. CG5]MCM2476876.1 HAMP domain-containing protein [Rhizobium sp. CG5]
MSRLSIKASLIAIFATIAIVSAVFAWLSVGALKSVDSAADELARNWLPSVKAAEEMKIETLSLRIAYLNHITARTPEATAAAEKTVLEEMAKVDQAIKRYEPLISSDAERQALKKIADGVQAYQKVGEDMLTLSRANQDVEAAVALDGMRELIRPVLVSVDELLAINEKGAESAITESEAAFIAAINQTYVIIAILALIIVVASIYALRSVAKPIERITDSMKHLADGNVDNAIPFAGRADEIGSMAAAVEIFRQAAIENNRLTVDAEFQRKSNEEQRIALQRVAEENARAKLLEATSALAVGMKNLADGDLTYQITQQVSDDFAGLRDDFNASVAQLAETLTAVAGATRTIDNGTREISSGTEDLSKRTEQQAASLEETAAALDQITVNVGNSSKRTEDARSVAIRANQSAAQSVQVVSHAEEAMGRIEESSKQISNIIGVIDEIAFQTNLLALNAGVEAARAGDAGKGFAVVAQEVRELAQRSASAAKEIKGLIQKSTTEVEGGVKLVRDTGVALQTIGDYITQINKHMDSIAVAAKEQSVGLAEVNTAVNQMDQVTQQNAAMVEESNAASASLAVESQRLSELISRFKLASGGFTSVAGSAPARRPQSPTSSSAPTRYPAPVRKVYASHGSAALKSDEWTEF